VVVWDARECHVFSMLSEVVGTIHPQTVHLVRLMIRMLS
jgi:hypothetical protein